MYAVATKSATDGLIRLFDDLVRCETRLYNAIGETLRREHGIATSQYEFLRYFRDHPGSRIADVAANFAAGIGAISKGVDRLEAAGWVARHPNPMDGRSSLVSLTPAGADLVADAETTFRERLAELVSAAMTPSDIDATGPVLARLRTTLESSRVGLPVG